MDDQQREQKKVDEERLAMERRKWLLSVHEEDAIRLSRDDWYDRNRYLREALGERHVRAEMQKAIPDAKRFWNDK